MKSICLACVIYTLKDKEPKDNLYFNVFYMWLTMLIKNGGLEKDDILHIHIDSRSLEYLENTYTTRTSFCLKANGFYSRT